MTQAAPRTQRGGSRSTASGVTRSSSASALSTTPHTFAGTTSFPSSTPTRTASASAMALTSSPLPHPQQQQHARMRRGSSKSSAGERKSSFSMSAWMRDPLAEVAEEVLHQPTTVWLAFRQIVTRTPDTMALGAHRVIPSSAATTSRKHDHAAKDGETEDVLSWQEYYEQVLALAKVLVHLGLQPGDGVVFSAKSSIALYLLNMAVLAAGGVVAHIRATWHARELIADIFPSARAKILVVDSLTDNFLVAVRQASAHQLRAVVVLRGYSMERALSWNLPVSVLTMDDMRSVARDAPEAGPAAAAWSVDTTSASGAVAAQPGDCCLIAFGYDDQGRVRGTCLSNDNVLFTAASLATSFGPLTWIDRMVAYLPLHHVAAQVLELYLPLLCGVVVYCAPTYRDASLLDVITRCKPTIFFATPDTWAHISAQVYRAKGEVNAFLYQWAKTRATNNSKKLRFGQDAHRSLGYMLAKKLVLNALKKKIGLQSCLACYSVLAPLDFELEKLFKTIDIPIYQLYGSAETSGFAAVNYPHAWEFGTSGRALKGTRMEYDDTAQHVLHRGRNVFMGYVRRGAHHIVPSQAHATPDSWYRVPQRAHLTPDGFLKLNDPPNDFLVLSTGDWVPVEPFERALCEQPELDRAVLVGDGRTFLSALLFMKTQSTAPTGTTAVTNATTTKMLSPTTTRAAASKLLLAEDTQQLGHSLGSHAASVAEVITCQAWAVHFDRVLEALPRRVGLSGPQVRKWTIMAHDFSVEGGELDPDTGAVRRSAVDRKYQALLDSLYS